MIRDMMMRFGRNNLGFMWIVVEPMILTSGVLLISSGMRSPYEHNTHVLSLVLTGYMPLTLWRHTTNHGPFLVRRSTGVLYHRPITILDVIVSRMMVEGAGTTAALLLVYSALWAVDVVPTIAHPFHLIAGWLGLFWLGAAFTLIVAAATEVSEAVEKFIAPAQYLLIPLSGVFYLTDWLPTRVQGIIAYNPISNCIEQFRYGFFGDDITAHFSPLYPAAFALVLTYFGLICLERARINLSTS